jgi:hypothetical protein
VRSVTGVIEIPSTLTHSTPRTAHPCCISSTILLEPLLRLIGENPRGQGRDSAPGTLIALGDSPGLHPDDERLELGGISHVNQTAEEWLAELESIIRCYREWGALPLTRKQALDRIIELGLSEGDAISLLDRNSANGQRSYGRTKHGAYV